MVEQLGLAMTPRSQGHILGVHLGNDQRNVIVHAKRAGVVDHDRTCGDNRLAHLLRHIGSAAEQGDVDALELLGRHLPHDERSCGNVTAAVERELLARAARRRQRAYLARREVEVVQHAKELASHRAGRARHRHHRARGHFIFPGHRILLRDRKDVHTIANAPRHPPVDREGTLFRSTGGTNRDGRVERSRVGRAGRTSPS